MKMKRIETREQLRAGLYIRVVLNAFGDSWCEVMTLRGSPEKRYWCNRKTHKAATKNWQINCGGTWNYLTDLGVGEWSRRLLRSAGSVLFKFDNRAFNYLSELAAREDKTALLTLLNKRPVTEKEVFDAALSWKEMKRASYEFHKERAYAPIYRYRSIA